MSYNKKLLQLITEKLNKPSKPKVPRNQWQHPGEVTSIPSKNITMRGVTYPVLGVDVNGYAQMMQPGEDYAFTQGPVMEYPMMQPGGQRNSSDNTRAPIKVPVYINPSTVKATNSVQSKDNRHWQSESKAKERQAAAADFVTMVSALGQYAPNPLIRYPAMALNSASGLADAYFANQEGDMQNRNINLIGSVPVPGYSALKTLGAGLGKKTADKAFRAALMSAGLDVFGTAADLTDNFGLEKRYGGQYGHLPKAQEGFEQWYNTIPAFKNDTTTYNLRRAYELAPREHLERFANNPKAHLNSVYMNPEGIYEFMKDRNHSSLQKELNWYNSRKGRNFRDNYSLDMSGRFYKYVPRPKMKKGGQAVGNKYSVVDYLNSIGIDASKENRRLLAQNFGIKDYDYSADKNMELLSQLQAKYDNAEPRVSRAQLEVMLANPKFNPAVKVNPLTLSQNQGHPLSSISHTGSGPRPVVAPRPKPPVVVKRPVAPPSGPSFFDQLMTTVGQGLPAGSFTPTPAPTSYKPIVDQVSSAATEFKELGQGVISGIQRQFEKMQDEDAASIVPQEKVVIAPSDMTKYGYQELYSVPDNKNSKNQLAAFKNVFDNTTGGRYYVGNKVKEVTDAGARREFDNVQAVAHFLRDSDILPNQKITPTEWKIAKNYTYKTTSPGKTVSAGRFNDPDWYRMLYKQNDDGSYNIKYVRNKDISEQDKKDYQQDFTVSGYHKFTDIDWDGEGPSTGYAAKSKWLNLKGNKGHTYIPYKNKDAFSRFSGGSGVYLFTDPKTKKQIGVDVGGSINTLRKVGEDIINEYGIKPEDLDLVYHDMGSYSAKPKANKGKLNYDQWIDYNTYNRGFSGAPLMIPIKRQGGFIQMAPGGDVENPFLQGFGKRPQAVADNTRRFINPAIEPFTRDSDVMNQLADAKQYFKGWMNSPMYKQMLKNSAGADAERINNNRLANIEETDIRYIHQQPKNEHGTAGYSNSNTGRITILPLGMRLLSPLTTHELSHSSDKPTGDDDYIERQIPQKDIQRMDKYTREYKQQLKDKKDKESLEWAEYVSDPTETRARLNDIRRTAKEMKVYDPFIEKITPNKLKKLEEVLEKKHRRAPGFNPYDQLRGIYFDEEIIDLLNSVSQNRNVFGNQPQVASKYGGSLYKMQPGGEKKEKGLLEEAWDTVTSWFSDEPAKPARREFPSDYKLRDPRKISATTGKPINPKRDLFSGNYSGNRMAELVTAAKRYGINPLDLLAVDLQETGWGNRSDAGAGHSLLSRSDLIPTKLPSEEEAMLDEADYFARSYKTKMNYADKLGIKDPALRIQVYNGLGKVVPETEQDYHGFKMQSIYGVPIPKGGIDMRKNPLYGKRIMDIRDNILSRDTALLNYIKEYSSGGQHGGLDRWFAEKWVDVKTGKECGRDEGEKRTGYPACRPSRRVNDDTPKTASELSSSEREKFVRSKTSSERINYQHRRKEYGGETNESDMANKPNNPSLWSKAKSLAKQKFDVYPSAYANGWAAKWYKSKGGTWRKAEYGMEVLPMMADGGKPEWLLEAQLKAQGYSGNALTQKMASMAQGGEPQNEGFQALPEYVQAKILANMGYGGMTYPFMQQGGEPDGAMALGQINAAMDKLMNLRKFIQPDSDLEPWVSSKLTLLDHYTDAVSDYMQYNPEAQGEMMMDDSQGLPMEQMKEGGIPQRYKNMGFNKVGTKKKSTRPGKKWMVLAKKGDDYKVVHGGYKGMQDYTQHGSDQRRKNFWNRMGGKNSSKATDPFSPLYWHKRFGTWANGGEIDMYGDGGYYGYDGEYHTSTTPTWSGNTGYEYGGYVPELAYGGMSFTPAKKSKSSKWKKQEGGPMVGDEMDVTPEQLEMLRQMGYEFELI